ncbi:NYN domain-containing protein [Candidatus Palauibacter soopunensis]|uniref:NYN domain-containing protein n=1 Tax=Candidatus Palauibacter soopunensis TaxID=3056739 RepID=UPI0023904A1E|nr:NYN domain-containing protein [Candidatus Palauibacter soopunensis]MDE2879426.1 NYN domain-containing protein [Candidatus Palauibacter soopunensis]
MDPYIAVLLDGEFVRKVLQYRTKPGLVTNVTPTLILAEVERILGHPDLTDHRLYRIFYYTADPSRATIVHPVTRQKNSLGQTETFTHSRWLTKQLETSPDVAVRRGTLAFRGWKLGSSAANALEAGSKSSVEARDIVPDLEQKGVDMRIGLDIASLALKRFVSTIVLVTGDADFIPAMKLARREGLRVLLDHLGRHVNSELRVHADLCI